MLNFKLATSQHLNHSSGEDMHTTRIWGSNLWNASKHFVIFKSDQAVIFF